MIYIPSKIHFQTAINQIKYMCELGIHDNTINTKDYYYSCIHYLESHEAFIIFCREVTPLRFNTKHLSISFKDKHDKPLPFNSKRTKKISHSLFIHDEQRVICESPKSKIGKDYQVFHFYLFHDNDWKPINPKEDVRLNKLIELNRLTPYFEFFKVWLNKPGLSALKSQGDN